MFTLYILRFANNSLYIGQTNNLSRRLLEHMNGSNWSAKFVKENGSFFELVYTEEYETRLEVMRRELQLKKWTRAKKEALIVGNFDPIISLVIVVVILIGTWDLLKDSVNLALDAVPDNINPFEVENYLKAIEGVQAVHDLHIWGMSTTPEITC